MTTLEQIQALLQLALQPDFLEVIDDSDQHLGHTNEGKGHYTIIINAPLFANKTMLECHRMIYKILQELMPSQIHALAIKIKR